MQAPDLSSLRLDNFVGILLPCPLEPCGGRRVALIHCCYSSELVSYWYLGELVSCLSVMNRCLYMKICAIIIPNLELKPGSTQEAQALVNGEHHMSPLVRKGNEHWMNNKIWSSDELIYPCCFTKFFSRKRQSVILAPIYNWSFTLQLRLSRRWLDKWIDGV